MLEITPLLYLQTQHPNLRSLPWTPTAPVSYVTHEIHMVPPADQLYSLAKNILIRGQRFEAWSIYDLAGNGDCGCALLLRSSRSIAFAFDLDTLNWSFNAVDNSSSILPS